MQGYAELRGMQCHGRRDRPARRRVIMDMPSPAAATSVGHPAPLLRVDGLTVQFATPEGPLPALRGISLSLPAGACLGIVGESGSGKSVTALAIMGLLPGQARVTAGRITLAGQDLLALPEAEMRQRRGGAIGMIFQDPMSSLNPAFPIGDQVAEAVRAHHPVSRREARDRATELLRQVRIPAAEARYGEYPHRLSGGMRQRVMIAMALAGDPALLIADEPTTALDVTVQAQIMDLLRGIQAERGTAILLISHNLGLVAGMADAVAVMYAGRVVEQGRTAQILGAPEHPYTVGLLGAVPRAAPGEARLTGIPGQVPDLRRPPPGCGFAPRCPFAEADCVAVEPPMRRMAPGHFTACARAPLDGIG
jgi:oligopeptide/dipeptide ABC transporter ATP-binding protein